MSNHTSEFPSIPDGYKKCTTCLEIKPIELFAKDPKSSDGRRNQCKACRAAAQRQRRIDKGDEVRAYDRKHYQKYPEAKKIRAMCSYHKHRDKRLVGFKNYHLRNGDKIRARKKDEYWRNPQIRNDRARDWRQRNPDKQLILKQKRKARKAALPDYFSVEDWQRCKDWFGHKCPICGNTTLTMDHWIPLINPDCPGTIPTNIVPLCKRCNFSKRERQASVWLIKNFGVVIALSVLARIEDYFLWLRQ